VNIGVAAHITAAAARGPRYDPSLSAEGRSSITNGIWLCQNCAKLIDNDVGRYSVELLCLWKRQAEESARIGLEGSGAVLPPPPVEITLKRRDIEIEPRRHDYKLEVGVRNIGTTICREWHVDLEFPTPVLTHLNGCVRSDRGVTLFRFAWRNLADDIFPGDRRQVFSVPYHVDDALFEQRNNLFSQPVRVSMYQGGRKLVVEQKFADFQCF
jgi:hypothetical protein